MVFAFVYGSKDTCRVVKRRSVPKVSLEQYLRRPPRAGYGLAPDEQDVAKFDFGGRGRPVHLVPSDDAKYLIAFANRAPRGTKPEQDAIWHLGENQYAPRVEYEFALDQKVAGYPKLERELRARKSKPLPRVESANYAFVSRGRAGVMLVARRSENRDGYVGEIVGFAIDLATQKATVASPAEARTWLRDGEPLWQAAGAWVLARSADRAHIPALKGALAAAGDAMARVHVAGALLACGDEGARKILGAALVGDDANARRVAALALLRAKPKPGDTDRLAACLTGGDATAAEIAQRALAHAGASGVRALIKASRATDPKARAKIARALATVDGADAERRLLALGREPDADILRAVAIGLTAPPRTILPDHVAAFAKVLHNAARLKHAVAARRLSVLAAHAKLNDRRVWAELIELTELSEKALWALNKLTGKDLKTKKEAKAWLKTQ